VEAATEPRKLHPGGVRVLKDRNNVTPKTKTKRKKRVSLTERRMCFSHPGNHHLIVVVEYLVGSFQDTS